MFSEKVKIYLLGNFLWILLAIPVADAKTPVHYKKWRLDDTTFVKNIGGAVRNYQRPNKLWAEIVNDFQTEGDSVFFTDKAVLRTRINKNGVSKVMLTWEENEYIVEQKLLGISWIKISTRQSQWIDSAMNWSNVLADSNIVKWTNVSPAVDYRALKNNGTVEHGIFYKPAFLDSAVTLYNQRPDSLDIALANVMVYTLSANIDDADSAMGELPWRRLKDFGYYSFNLRNQRLRFPGCDTLPKIPVRQYWERRGTKIICIEYVMMRRIKQVHEVYPAATIWHNDTKKIEGTTNVEDTYIFAFSPNNNYGGGLYMLLYASSNGEVLIRVKNVSVELDPGAIITACVCSLYCEANTEDGTASAYRIFKPWEEGTQFNLACESPGCSWNDWACTDNEWGTEGCKCAKDAGIDNNADNGACINARADRKETAEDTEDITTVDTWYAWNVSAALAQDWYDGTANENGIVLLDAGATCNNLFTSTEAASNQPFWVFTYTTGEPEVGTIMRTVIR